MKDRIILFIICALITPTLSAQNWLAVWGNASMNWQQAKSPLTTSKIGEGFSIGIGWQYQIEHFTIETGLEGNYTHFRTSISDTLLSYNMIDTKGTRFVYNGYLSNRLDNLYSIHLSVPLLLGIEYTAFSSIRILLTTPIARAPPEFPSPVTTEITGT